MLATNLSATSCGASRGATQFDATDAFFSEFDSALADEELELVGAK